MFSLSPTLAPGLLILPVSFLFLLLFSIWFFLIHSDIQLQLAAGTVIDSDWNLDETAPSIYNAPLWGLAAGASSSASGYPFSPSPLPLADFYD
jgi:hypothetical protein